MKLFIICLFGLIAFHLASSYKSNIWNITVNSSDDDIKSRIKDCFYFEFVEESVELVCENVTIDSNANFDDSNNNRKNTRNSKDNCYATLFESDSMEKNRAKVTYLRTGQCRSIKFDNSLAELFPNLKFLDISHFGIEQSIAQQSLNLKSLKSLNASNNQLSKINDFTFSKAKSIVQLDFSHNNMVSILTTSFNGANSLESIDLSYNLIAYLQSTAFEQLPNLQSIDLSANKLYTFDISMLKNNLNLREIHIQRNQMKRFVYDGNAIPAFESLLVFRAGENKIENVFDELLQRSASALQVLDLSENYLDLLREWRFYGRHNLRHVNLRRTGFLHFNFSVFENPAALISLDLSENILMVINFTSDFGHFNNLQVLYLRDNELKHLDGATFERFPKLAMLDISRNKLTCEYAEKFVRQWKNLSIVGDPCDQMELPDKESEMNFFFMKMTIILICYISFVAVSIALAIICFKRFRLFFQNDENILMASTMMVNHGTDCIYEENIYCEIEPQTYIDTYDHLAFRGLTPSSIKSHYDNTITLRAT